jgi:DNA-binding NtrC family response regulator
MNIQLAKKLLNISAPILITGPTGSGKSRLARKLFESSKIHRDRFLTLHLASLKEDLLESELFGHRRGSFTGAVENKNGYFKDVGTGTLFLDEIGELSLESQKKLLYLLEEKKYTPIGSTHALNFSGRLIMATNKNLKAMVTAGTFREDLYFRVSIFHLELESLNQDKARLEKEIYKTFEQMKERYQKHHLSLENDVFHLLMNAEWKGNYRELKNCMEFTVALCEGTKITRSDLPGWFLSGMKKESAKTEVDFISHFPEDFNLALESFEGWYLQAMFERFSGRVNETARVLGISKTTLINKARKYGIDTLQIRAKANVQKTSNLAA